MQSLSLLFAATVQVGENQRQFTYRRICRSVDGRIRTTQIIMKKVKLTIAAVAAIAVTATAAMAGKSNQTASVQSMEALDCWSIGTPSSAPADIDQQAECPSQNGDCCYKPAGGGLPVRTYSFNAL